VEGVTGDGAASTVSIHDNLKKIIVINGTRVSHLPFRTQRDTDNYGML